MKKYSTDKIRNIALISHGGAGKTSLAEAMIFNTKATTRLGRVEDGNTISDFDAEEIKRTISISTGLVPCEWQDHKINVLDTPGYFDFVGEVKAGLRVADAAAVVVCGVSGVEVGTELVWQYADENQLPRIVVINKLNRENADYFKIVNQLREYFGTKVVPLYVPIGKEEDFHSVLNILTNKAYEYSGDGRTVKEIAAPAALIEQVEAYRIQLVEAIVEQDDEMMMMYLEEEEIPVESLIKGLRASVMNGDITPVFASAATKNIGVQAILDAMIDLLPAPKATEEAAGEPSALVFKTMADPYVGKINIFKVFSGSIQSDSQYYNVTKENNERFGQVFVMSGKNQIAVKELAAGDIGGVAKLSDTDTNDTIATKNHPIVVDPIVFPNPIMSMTVEPLAKGDEDKIGTGLTRLQEEDPTFSAERNSETGENVVSGMGDMHLQIIKSRLHEKYGIEVVLKASAIPYRETIKKQVEAAHKHKKQSGGKGQYGHVIIDVEPLHDDEKSYEFVDKIFGGSVPRQYIPAVDKGIVETLPHGPLANYPVVNVKVTLKDGSYHDVDSSEMAFKLAASQAFKKGFIKANPVLLEPILNLEVTVPEDYMGDIMGDLNKKRGRIMGMEPKGRKQVIKATVPLSEMSTYATDLRSMTQGRGLFVTSFAHYDEVPGNIAEKIIEERNKKEE